MSKTIFIIVYILFAAASGASNWTVALYMVADNDLAPWCVQDLEELQSVGSKDGLTIIAQVDWPDSGAKRYLVNQGSLEILMDFGQINSGDPASLAEFASWSFLNYPATNLTLVIWDHGNGWTKGLSEVKGICWDGSANDFISVSEGELRYALSRTKRRLGRKIDIVAFDACLMQMVEVLSELRDAVDFVVGSEHLVPIEGFPYDSILSKVGANPSITPRGLADLMVTEYIHYYTETSNEVTLSRVDLSMFEELLDASREFSSVLRANATHPSVRYARGMVQTFSIEHVPPTPEDDHIDYYNFAQLLSDSYLPSMSSPANTLVELIDSSTFSQFHGAELQNAHGIAIWFPDNYSAFISNAYEYRNLDFASATNWEKAIYPYYGVSDTFPPTTPQVHPIEPDESNSYDVNWEPSYDLSDVERYELIEAKGVGESFWDDAESGGEKWEMNGFLLSSGLAHTGSHSYFSHSGELQTRNSISISREGRLSVWCTYRMRKAVDFLRVEISSDGEEWTTIDSVTGIHEAWKKVELNVDVDSFYLRFRFTSDGAMDHWVYLDDIRVDSISSLDTISAVLKSTCYRFFHKQKGTYYYQLRACDGFGNQSKWSDFAVVNLPNYFPPFGYPNPFQNSVTIAFDGPQEEHILMIYNLMGQRIKTINTEFGQHEVLWDGTDDSGVRVPSGIYFCVVEGISPPRSGKLIRLR